MTDKAYKVLRIVEMTKRSDLEGVELYYRHTIKTKGGVVLSVDIATEDFTEDKAAPLLLAAASNADKIKAL